MAPPATSAHSRTIFRDIRFLPSPFAKRTELCAMPIRDDWYRAAASPVAGAGMAATSGRTLVLREAARGAPQASVRQLKVSSKRRRQYNCEGRGRAILFVKLGVFLTGTRLRGRRRRCAINFDG